MKVSEKSLRETDKLILTWFDFRYGDYLISWVPMVEQLGGAVVSADERSNCKHRCMGKST